MIYTDFVIRISLSMLLVKIIQSVRGNPVLIEISVLCPP